MKIEKANNNDHKILTKITKESKSFWGYSLEQMEQWNQLLTISQNYLNTHFVYKLILKEEIIGYYSYFLIDEKNIHLDNLFILPKYIGKGFGKYLIQDFFDRIKEHKTIEKVILEADPNAEIFYQKLGFNTIKKIETSIKNRLLPLMEFRL